MHSVPEITAGQVASYVISHPQREQVFPGWHNDQIMHTIINHMRDNEVLVVTLQDAIQGLLIFDETTDPNTLRIDSILVSHPIVLPMFISMWFHRYPDKTLVARRHGRIVRYTRRSFERLVRNKVAPVVETPASVNYAICNNDN